jgi:hypothetical protein
MFSTVGSSPTRITKDSVSVEAERFRLLIWWRKSTVGSNPTGVTNKMERVAQLVEHVIYSDKYSLITANVISSDVKSYFGC